MTKKASTLLGVFAIVIAAQITLFGQTTGSIAGTVTDANGAVVAGAKVTTVGLTGVEFTTVTTDNGTFRVPALGTGLYTLTITAPHFKKTIIENVKVDVGLPTTANAVLEVGAIDQSVTITSGGEVLQTQTATVGATITGRQILETPIASRDALDLVGLLPGTATVGAPRRASVNGLPKGALSITIDGVDVQDNTLRSSDGYFTYVRPRIDAIEEVTVSNAVPGSETGGDGAVQIRFVTRRGNNEYRGGAFWQHRNTALNAAYWYNNRDLAGPDTRNTMLLNQFGANFGGPLPFPRFGEGGPRFDSGKDKAFFFVNYEEFRLPASQTRTRQVLTPLAQAGTFSYIVGGQTRTADLYSIAQAAATAGCASCLTTPDPTIATMLADIRAAVQTTGSLTPRPNAPNLQDYTFTPTGDSPRKFLVMRFDANITKNHSVEFVTNQQEFVQSKDFLNSQDERFPGYAAYTQGSNRDSYSTAVRSNFGTNVVNEARYAISTGMSIFSPTISAADFNYTLGYSLGIDASGATTPYSRNSYSDRNVPSYDLTDNVTWLHGNHTITFGGQYKRVRSTATSQGRIVPTVGFGLVSGSGSAGDPAFDIFSTSSLPGANSTQLTEARNLYATLIGRINAYTSTAALTADGTYAENGSSLSVAEQKTYGLYAQDSWRIKPNLTVNFGLRWQPQGPFVALTEGVFSKLENYSQLWGISGEGNIFMPGTLTGQNPRVVSLKTGENAYPADWNNFGPSVGVVWSPDFSGNGFLKAVFGGAGKSVFRVGYSESFVREGFDLLASILGANPGRTFSLTRSSTTSGAGAAFVLRTNLRDANNPNLRAATYNDLTPIVGSSPSFPIALTTADSTNAFDPNLKTGRVRSYSVGYQRELGKDMVVEFRYVGNRGVGLQRQYNINEFNTVENGFANEFRMAQGNLYANEAAFAAGNVSRRYCPGVVVGTVCQTSATNTTVVARVPTFAYFGSGTNTSPLPIMLSYFNTAANFTPGGTNATQYGGSSGTLGTNFSNSTLAGTLVMGGPNAITSWAGTNFENSTARRNNAIANLRPPNFFYVNPTTGTNGSFTVDNSSETWFDSAVIEFRRRLSNGLRVQASYVFGKAMSNYYASSSSVFAGFTQREGGLDLAKNVQAFDIRHQFKFDATYDLPFGTGRRFGGSANAWVNAVIGNWTILPTLRWQSGSPFSLGNVQLVGMTVKELQKEIGVYKDTMLPGATREVVTYLPVDIIVNTQRAFDLSAANITSNNGYGTQFGTGGPTGRFIAPAGYGNCISEFSGQCGFNNLIVYGPSFFKLDVALSKKFPIGEKRSVEFRAMFLDALNHPNFRVGGWGVDTVSITAGGATFGQLASGSAYQDISTTNDPGGRLIDLMLRIYF